MNSSSERIYLRPLSFKELESNYVNWLNDQEVCKYNSHGDYEYTKEMAEKFIKSLENDDTKEVYAVYLKEKDIHIGNISLQNIDRKNNKAEIAYLFGEKAYWAQGFASEASRILIQRAFEDLKLHRLYFGTSEFNIPMQKLGEKLGFVLEGKFKDDQYKNGKYNDIYLYGLIKNL